MIQIEYIVDDNKSLLTIIFNKKVLDHLKAKCDDYLNFIQSTHNLSFITLFKADTGYRIIRVPGMKKTYQIYVRHPLIGFKDFECTAFTYYLKKNGIIRVMIKFYYR